MAHADFDTATMRCLFSLSSKRAREDGEEFDYRELQRAQKRALTQRSIEPFAEVKYTDEHTYNHSVSATEANSEVTQPKNGTEAEHSELFGFCKVPCTTETTNGSYIAARKAVCALDGECFFTTLAVLGTRWGAKVSGVLVDSGAAATFIARPLLDSIGGQTYGVEPHRFKLADGRITIFDEAVDIIFMIGPVFNAVRCFVDNDVQPNELDRMLLFGKTAHRIFNADHKHSVGREKLDKLTVAQDEAGKRNDLFVVAQDGPHVEPNVIVKSFKSVKRWARSNAYTTKELEAKLGKGRSTSKHAGAAARMKF